MILTPEIFQKEDNLRLDFFCKNETQLQALIDEKDEEIYNSCFFSEKKRYADLTAEDIANVRGVTKYFAFLVFLPILIAHFDLLYFFEREHSLTSPIDSIKSLEGKASASLNTAVKNFKYNGVKIKSILDINQKLTN